MQSIRTFSSPGGLTLAVPTFRRARLLARLIEQLGRQSRRPDSLIVIDGEGGSRAVREVSAASARNGLPTRLLRSTQANLPFQRYLAWRAAPRGGVLLFLDDDLLLPSPHAVARLIAPLTGDGRHVAATTAPIRCAAAPPRPSWPARRFGASRVAPPGSLTPGGCRVDPAPSGTPYPEVGWLRGGAMAFRSTALSEDCFSHDLFALAGRGWGMGEDLALALRVLRRGKILLARRARFEHPGDDPGRAVRSDPAQLGFASAYSRRLLNDLYRGDRPPAASDRLALARTYLGTLAQAGCSGRAVFAAGWAAGAVLGLCRPPRARRLTPGIDWEAEAERSLASAEVLGP